LRRGVAEVVVEEFEKAVLFVGLASAEEEAQVYII
jgi:hypothetical protein